MSTDVDDITTPGEGSVSIPAGAISLVLECIGSGEDGYYWGGHPGGGGGGGYAKRTYESLTSITRFDYNFAGHGAGGGTVHVWAVGIESSTEAQNGGGEGNGRGGYVNTGDVTHTGGNGFWDADGTYGNGGGAAGPERDGFAADEYNAGQGGGSPAGGGGYRGDPGTAWGGGGSHNGSTAYNGADGGIRFTWTIADPANPGMLAMF